MFYKNAIKHLSTILNTSNSSRKNCSKSLKYQGKKSHNLTQSKCSTSLSFQPTLPRLMSSLVSSALFANQVKKKITNSKSKKLRCLNSMLLKLKHLKKWLLSKQKWNVKPKLCKNCFNTSFSKLKQLNNSTVNRKKERLNQWKKLTHHFSFFKPSLSLNLWGKSWLKRSKKLLNLKHRRLNWNNYWRKSSKNHNLNIIHQTSEKNKLNPNPK